MPARVVLIAGIPAGAAPPSAIPARAALPSATAARAAPPSAIPARTARPGAIPARAAPPSATPARVVLARALLAGGAALAVAQGAPGLTALAPVRRLFPGLAGAGPPDHVALTFDDGPDPRFTPRFLAMLAARRVHATFFLLGPMVQAAPQLAAEIAAAGHEIGVHGWEHRYATVRGPRALHDDLARACDMIAAATGAVPRLYRPPYGVLSAGALIAARRLGLRPILWSTWGREWSPGATPVSVQATLARTLGGGVTVLLHDSDCTAPPGTAAAALGALPWLLDECAGRGLRAGPLAGHLADGSRPG